MPAPREMIWSLVIWLALSAPDPAMGQGILRSLERAVPDASKAIEKGAKDIGKAIEKGAQDTGTVLEKGSRDVAEQSPSDPCTANPTLPQCADLDGSQRSQ